MSELQTATTEELETRPRATAVLKSVKKEGDEVIATLFMKNGPDNIGTVLDLGYGEAEKTTEDIVFEISISDNEELGLDNFGDFLCNKALWVIGTKSEYTAKREFSKILIEFFDTIEDGRTEA